MSAGRPKDHIVESNGIVYRVGRNNFKSWLKAKANGDSPTIGSAGGRVVLSIERNVSDYTSEEAAAELSKMGDSVGDAVQPEVSFDF